METVEMVTDAAFLVMAADEGAPYADIAEEYGIEVGTIPPGGYFAMSELDVACRVARLIADERAAWGKPTSYTKRQLEEINPAQAAQYMITDRTATRVNAAVAIVENGDTLRTGDIVLYTDPYDGKQYRARYEPCGYMGDSICLQATTPHLLDNGHTSTSGGPWVSIEPSNLRFVERAAANFWVFAGLPCAHSGVNFTATVRVWEYMPEVNHV
jgi:hypothetical protein